MDILDLARNVKRGVRVLDAKIPHWRRILRKHEDEFDFADGEFCVLGTLEHHTGRAAIAKLKRSVDTASYPIDLGFDGDRGEGAAYARDVATLDSLWRAEFESI